MAVAQSDGGPAGVALAVERGIADAEVQVADRTSISIPTDAFVHTDANATVSLEAVQADGAPLPAWMAFDPASGTFTVEPPPGVEGTVEVRVIARDSEGREAVTIFKIKVGKDQAPRSGLEGRSGLSEQLRQAARPLGLSERLAALSRSAQAAAQRMQA